MIHVLHSWASQRDIRNCAFTESNLLASATESFHAGEQKLFHIIDLNVGAASNVPGLGSIPSDLRRQLPRNARSGWDTSARR